jgi:2'-5' RNA ligase
MTDLTAVDILIEPDAATIERARAVNARMPLSIPAGITLDETHLPHITLLQRYLITVDLEQAYAAIETTIDGTDTTSLAFTVTGIAYSEAWGPPGQAAAGLLVHPNSQVLDLQANLISAVTPFVGSGGTDDAFATDPGQHISQTTKDWVQTYVPDQTGTNFTAHLTVGLDTVDHLKTLQAEPFEAFDIHPIGLAVYQLGNNGTARRRLNSWPLHT